MVCNEKIRHLRYEPLRKQLSEIVQWPHRYHHKVIGINGQQFREGVEEFQRQFPQLRRRSTALSRNGTYLAMTFELDADHVDEIIELWVASEEISDFVRIL